MPGAQNPLQQDIPPKQWNMFRSDLFEIEGHQWLIIAHYYTKHPIIRQLPNPSQSSVVVNATKQIFAVVGIPDGIVTDKGRILGVKLTVISYGHGSLITSQLHLDGPRKRFYRTTSEGHHILLKKSKQSGADCHFALLHRRTRPINATLASPGQLIMGPLIDHSRQN